jgi:uncharacterized protein YbjT (DUF2867 family)
VQTVLVAGAAGYLGRYAAMEFKNRGYRVRAFVRNADKLRLPGPSMEPPIDNLVDEVFVGDATKPDSLDGLCDGIDVVFSSMGLTRPDPKLNFEAVDHLGNRRILDLALKAGVRKFVYVSIFRAEEMIDNEVVKVHEEFVDDLRASGMDYAIVRPNGYFSDMGQFLKIARKGIMFWLGDGHNKINPIHGADLAVVCVDAMEGTAKEIDAGGPDMFTFKSLFELAFHAIGKNPRIFFIPLWVGDGMLSILRIFSPRLAGVASFAVEVNRMENDAPPYGTHHLEEYYRELVKSGR